MKAKLTEITPAMEATSHEAIDATVSSLKESAEKATAGLESTQIKVKEGMERAMKTAEEMVSFTQGNVEAVVKSGQIWAAGVQDLSKHVAATAQANFEQTVSTIKAMSGVKSLKDMFELQAAFARSAMEKTMTDSGKLTDASLKLTEQTIAPLTARVTLAVEKMGRAA